MILTPQQICQIARAAGFRDTAEVSPGVSEVACFCAIAMRESAGNPEAFNGNAATGDRSYGLWQINLRDPNVGRFVYEHILNVPLNSGEDVPNNPATEGRLFDPATNAAAAWTLYGGRLNNIYQGWYINRPGPPEKYQERYQSWLPIATAAALATEPQKPTQGTIDGEGKKS